MSVILTRGLGVSDLTSILSVQWFINATSLEHIEMVEYRKVTDKSM